MARQLVRPQVDFAAVGEAGMVRNYEGEALAAIGTIIGEAISNVKPKADKIKEQEDEIFKVPVLEKPGSITPGEYEYDFSAPSSGSSTPSESKPSESKVDEALEKPINGGGRLDYYSPVFEKFTKRQKSIWESKGAEFGRSGVDQYIHHMENELPEANKKAKETVKQFAASKPKGFVYDPMNPTHVNEFKASKYYDQTLPYNFQQADTPGLRLKDDSPFERQRQVSARPRNRALAGMSNEQQFNMQAMRGATMSQLPTEASGRSFVEKQRYLRTPSWASGTSVAAAIEGWNIGVEASNYRAQVKADFKDFQNREWEATKTQAKADSLLPKSQIAAMKYLQEQFVESENLPPVERNEIRARIADQLTDIERSSKTIQDTQAWIDQNFSSLNIDMFSAEQLDMFNTIRDGGGITALLPNENGKMAYMGLTKGQMPFNTDISSFADIKNGFLATLPRKVDIYSQMNAIADNIKDDDYSRTTVDADGIIRKTPIPLEDLKAEIDYELGAVINQQGLKNIAGSLPIYQGEKGRDAFTLSMRKFDTNDPRHPYNVVKQHLAEGIHHKLSGYMGQVTEEEGKGALEDQKQRNRMEKAAFDAEQKLKLEQFKQSDPSKKRKGANEANNVKADYLDLAKAYAEKIVNNNDPKDLEDRLRAVMPKGTEFNYNSDTRNFTISTPSKVVTKNTVNAEGEESESTTTTEGQDQMLSFNRSIGDLIPILQDLMYENNLNVSSDMQTSKEAALQVISQSRAKRNQAKQ